MEKGEEKRSRERRKVEGVRVEGCGGREAGMFRDLKSVEARRSNIYTGGDHGEALDA